MNEKKPETRLSKRLFSMPIVVTRPESLEINKEDVENFYDMFFKMLVDKNSKYEFANMFYDLEQELATPVECMKAFFKFMADSKIVGED
jgi:hypothetical protein